MKKSNMFPIASTVYMDKIIKNKLIRENILLVEIVRDFNKIKNRQNIYNNKMKHVIGKDIQNPKLRNNLKIINNTNLKEFYKKLSKIKL